MISLPLAHEMPPMTLALRTRGHCPALFPNPSTKAIHPPTEMPAVEFTKEGFSATVGPERRLQSLGVEQE